MFELKIRLKKDIKISNKFIKRIQNGKPISLRIGGWTGKIQVINLTVDTDMSDGYFFGETSKTPYPTGMTSKILECVEL